MQIVAGLAHSGPSSSKPAMRPLPGRKNRVTERLLGIVEADLALDHAGRLVRDHEAFASDVRGRRIIEPIFPPAPVVHLERQAVVADQLLVDPASAPAVESPRR